ncbi:MAG TPA: selenide, water dikinase SelD [Burkholderiales bacterium]|nr:selenide, water dikinase SelD [Burkholderiales bacterium]
MNQLAEIGDIKLTAFSHGGGCGCKIAPAALREILSKSALGKSWPNLLVGAETSDDAAVYKLNEMQALIATTDFFTPIVDDPYDFGRIAATNALSDIYAMGGRPVLALAIVGMPIGKLPVPVIQRILSGGEDICSQAGIPIAGGHSIDSPEPIYGLVGLGLAHPDKIRRNDTARAGDAVILGKALGVGIMSAALKKGKLSDQGYRQMVESTTQLNCAGVGLADITGVHAITDVTGYGLLGHLLEVCTGSGLGAEISFAALPIFSEALGLAKQGFGPGAIERNWASYCGQVVLPQAVPEWQKKLLCDPQTSGGLLVACDESDVQEALSVFRDQGFDYAARIGRMKAGAAEIRLVE